MSTYIKNHYSYNIKSRQNECKMLRDEINIKIEYGYKIRFAMYTSVGVVLAFLYEIMGKVNNIPEFAPIIFLSPILIIIACYIEDLETIESIFSIAAYLALFHRDIYKWELRLIGKFYEARNNNLDYQFDEKSHTIPYVLMISLCFCNFVIYSILKEKILIIYVVMSITIYIILVLCILHMIKKNKWINFPKCNFLLKYFIITKQEFSSRNLMIWNNVKIKEKNNKNYYKKLINNIIKNYKHFDRNEAYSTTPNTRHSSKANGADRGAVHILQVPRRRKR